MKWLWVLLLVVIAIVLFLVGILASADPEGRGGPVAALMLSAASAVLVAAVSLSVYLW